VGVPELDVRSNEPKKITMEEVKVVRKSVFVLCVVAALVLMVGALAIAQEEEAAEKAKPYTLKLGALMPNNSDLKDITKDTWLLVGVEKAGVKEANWMDCRSVDYSEVKGSTPAYDTDIKVRTIGLLGTRKWIKPVEEGAKPGIYFGAGLGIYMIDIEDNTNKWSRATTRLGLHVLVGTPLGKTASLELRWSTIDKIWIENKARKHVEVDPGNISLYLGIPF